MKILVVCTGNLCRSPMAEALLRHALDERGCEDIEVVSAGTWADVGYPATRPAVDVLRGRGVDLSMHKSRPLDPEEVLTSDLLVGMTSVHVKEILEVAPEAESKLVLLKEIPEIERDGDLPEGASRAERLEHLLAGTRPQARRSLDVDDPIGLPVGAYERCARDLDGGIEALASVLCR